MAFLNVYIEEDFFKERLVLRYRINRNAGRSGLSASRKEIIPITLEK